jgi:putative sterol carrier protein
MVKYLTEEWAVMAKKKVLEELDPKQDLRSMNASLMNVVQNVPPDQKTVYFYIRFVDGKLEELLASPDDSVKQKPAEFTVTGDYTTFVQISSGQMTSAMALLKNRVKMAGSKIKAFSITKPIDTFNSCIAKMTVEY